MRVYTYAATRNNLGMADVGRSVMILNVVIVRGNTGLLLGMISCHGDNCVLNMRASSKMKYCSYK
jgi:hypothetical protein